MLSLRRASIAALAIAVITATAVLFAQAGNPLSGNWIINLAKSKYSPANLTLKSSTSRFDATQNEVKLVNEGVDAQGRVTRLGTRRDSMGSPIR